MSAAPLSIDPARLRGIAAPLVTPRDQTGAVCETGVRQLIASLAGHVDILLPTLSSGEGWKLNDPQWQAMLTHTLRHARGLPVFPGIMVDTDTDGEARFLQRARFAHAAGASGITLPVPALDPASALTQYRAWVRQSPLPVFVYYSLPCDSEAALDTLIAICQLEQVVAVKESSRNPQIVARLLQAGVKAAVFQGWEDACLASPGVAGYAVALANLEPALCAAMWREPTTARQQQIDQCCEQYGLFAEDWYAALKQELARRQVLPHSMALEG